MRRKGTVVRGKKKPRPGGRRFGGGGMGRHKACRICTESGLVLDYKHYKLLQQFLTDRGKVVPRRITGMCAPHQRQLTRQVRRARQIALVPYAALHAF